jgi:ABC-2 type transport system ATP-binding protein
VTTPPALAIADLQKTYASGLRALSDINLTVNQGEIFALLGPNGAGKTTLISIICGIVRSSAGAVTVEGRDIVRDFRAVRSRIGLVPQELTTDQFETVGATVKFSRRLFGCPANPGFLQQVLNDLSLADKVKDRILTLSGGMKRRVMIAKALAHEPKILFLDEPTAGVDVELRRDMWTVVRRLRDQGVTIILTTHYIEEAEELADRIGVINQGRLILVEEKQALMRKLGRKQLVLQLQQPLTSVPAALQDLPVSLQAGGSELRFDSGADHGQLNIPLLLHRVSEAGINFRDLYTRQSSLEDIFVDLLKTPA